MITTQGGTRVLYRCFAEQSLRFAFKDLLRSEPGRLLAYGANAEVFNENTKSICGEPA